MSKTNSRKSYVRKQRNQLANAARERITSVPQTLQTDPVQSWVSRFGVADAASDVVSVTWEFPIPPFALATGSLSLVSFMKSIRIKKIEIFCDYRSASNASANTINLQVIERRGVRPVEWSSTASPIRNGHICAKFAKNSPLGWYYNTTTAESNPEVTVQLPKGAIMDIHFAYIMDDADPCANLASSGLTSSRIYTNTISSNLQVFGRSHQTAFPAL